MGQRACSSRAAIGRCFDFWFFVDGSQLHESCADACANLLDDVDVLGDVRSLILSAAGRRADLESRRKTLCTLYTHARCTLFYS